MGLTKKTKQEKVKVLIESSDHLQAESFELPTRFEEDTGVELDVIERLKSNIAMLDDLQKRLGFMNSELESIIGRRQS